MILSICAQLVNFMLIVSLLITSPTTSSSDMLIIRHGRSRVRHSNEKDYLRWGLKALDNLTLDYDITDGYDNDTTILFGNDIWSLDNMTYFNQSNNYSVSYGSSANPSDEKFFTPITPVTAVRKSVKKKLMESIRKNVDKGLEYLKLHGNLQVSDTNQENRYRSEATSKSSDNIQATKAPSEIKLQKVSTTEESILEDSHAHINRPHSDPAQLSVSYKQHLITREGDSSIPDNIDRNVSTFNQSTGNDNTLPIVNGLEVEDTAARADEALFQASSTSGSFNVAFDEIPSGTIDNDDDTGDDNDSALSNVYGASDEDLSDLDEISRKNRLNLMKGRDVVTKFLQIVESQHLLGANCTAGTALNLGEGVVDQYAQDRFRIEAEVAVNRANMLTRIFKLTSLSVQASEHLLHASVLSMVEFDDDIFAAGNCFDWNQHPSKSGLFCPFAYRLPPPDQGASFAKDLAAEYHYLGNTSEWFFLARKNADKVIAKNDQYIKAYHFYLNSTSREADVILSVKYDDGRWSKPYYDCGGGNIWMLTYTVPFFGFENGSYFFKGTSGIDIDLRRVDIDQCPQRNMLGTIQPLNIFAGTDKCKQRTTMCEPITGLGFRRGSYKCLCRKGFYFPNTTIGQKYFNGSILEEEYEKLMLGENSLYSKPLTYECLPCAEGCDYCEDSSPCVAALNWPMRTSILVLACAVIGFLPPAAWFTFRYQQVKPEGSISADFLELLMFGYPSEALEQFLVQDLTEKGLKKLCNSIELSYSTIQKLVIKPLHNAAINLFYYLNKLKALIVPKASETALSSAGAFLIKIFELQQTIAQSVTDYKTFWCWLSMAIIRLMDETVPDEVSSVTKQDITYLARIFSSIIKYKPFSFVVDNVINTQQKEVVRAASPALLRVIAMGAFFIYCTTIVMYPPPSLYTCTARIWLRELGFSLTYGALMLKTWRISVIFRVRSAKAVKITDAALLKRLGVICGAIGACLLVRTVISPPEVVVGRTADDLKAFLCKTDWWDYTFTSMEVLFLAWGVRLCIMVRKAPSEFNESRFISMAIYNEFLLTCFLNVSMLFLQSPANPDLLYIIFFCHTQLTVTLLLGLIFGSKVYIVLRSGKCQENTIGLGVKSSGAKFNFRPQIRTFANPSTATSSTAQLADTKLTDQEALEEIHQLSLQLQRVQELAPPRGIAVMTISSLLDGLKTIHQLAIKPQSSSSLPVPTLGIDSQKTHSPLKLRPTHEKSINTQLSGDNFWQQINIETGRANCHHITTTNRDCDRRALQTQLQKRCELSFSELHLECMCSDAGDDTESYQDHRYGSARMDQDCCTVSSENKPQSKSNTKPKFHSSCNINQSKVNNTNPCDIQFLICDNCKKKIVNIKAKVIELSLDSQIPLSHEDISFHSAEYDDQLQDIKSTNSEFTNNDKDTYFKKARTRKPDKLVLDLNDRTKYTKEVSV